MKQLPPYNPEAKCPKCGHDRVTTYWVSLEDSDKYDEWHCDGNKQEHHNRTCERCRFSWAESVLKGAGAA